ncbi:hypothetical protein CYMTET_14627 [Cymbomonas tetramitiformis]|uniref:Uncharacterized protein n=1 Tax=Cymbomonas tetramitiformis TaxID=36881 RepID=A0AAE0LA68_9CHLO|nr:hypothetical protein CYMTET_14627 [Cymbomonas tetramitiformis]
MQGHLWRDHDGNLAHVAEGGYVSNLRLQNLFPDVTWQLEDLQVPTKMRKPKSKLTMRKEATKLMLCQRALRRERQRDLTSSEELCNCVQLNFTVLMMSLPIEWLREQAAAALRRKSYTYKLTRASGKRHLQVKSPTPSANSSASQQHSGKRAASVHFLLSLERCLGTSLVHAFLELNSCLIEECHHVHLASAEILPWECAPGKGFLWLRDVFQEMLAAEGRPGWYMRSRLYTLLFVQDPDGHFQISQELANALWAGTPAEAVGESIRGAFERPLLRVSMPLGLLLKEGAKQASVEDMEEAERVWATLLGVALYHHLPLHWWTNPKAPPAERVSIGRLGEMWLEADARRGHIRHVLPELRAMAANLVVQWEQAHVQRLTELKEQSTTGSTVNEKRPPLWKRGYRWVARSAFWVISSHPLVAIYLVKPTEAFSRAERLVVQVNVFVIMLSFCMFFYLSRAIECCTEFKGYVGCPDAGMRTSECLGQPTCQMLFLEKKSGFLPEELGAPDFVCTAFPTTSWMDRVWMVLFINAGLIPVNVILMAMFTLSGGSAVAPGHMSMDVGKKVAQLMGPQRGAVMTNLIMVLYAVLFDIKLLTKTMAMAFMAMFGMIFQPVKLVTKYIEPLFRLMLPVYLMISATYYRICWFFWARVVLVGTSVARCWGQQPPQKLVYKDPVLVNNIRIEGLMDGMVDKVAYSFLAGFWIADAYILFVFGKVIREINGPEAENDLIRTWALTFVFEQFGIKAIKLMMVRSAGRYISKRYDQLITGKTMFDILAWYEGYILETSPFVYEAPDGDAFFGGVDMIA